MSGVHITAAGFIECSLGLNVTGVVLEALCGQPVKVSTECSKATHQLGDVACPSESFLELTERLLDSPLTTSKKPKHCKNCSV